jgi:hypothetical protein
VETGVSTYARANPVGTKGKKRTGPPICRGLAIALTPPLFASLKFGLGFAVNTPKLFGAYALSLVSSPYIPLYAPGPPNPDAGEVDAGESVA